MSPSPRSDLLSYLPARLRNGVLVAPVHEISFHALYPQRLTLQPPRQSFDLTTRLHFRYFHTMTSRSPSRGRDRSRTRSPTPRSDHSRRDRRRYDSRSPSRSLSRSRSPSRSRSRSPTPRRNGKGGSYSRSRSRRSDSRDRSLTPIRSTKVRLPASTRRMCLSSRLTLHPRSSLRS